MKSVGHRTAYSGVWAWRSPRASPAFATSFATLLAAVVFPSRGAAQGGEWPTLSGAGLEYVSASGFFQLSLSGQLDLEAFRLGDSRPGLVVHSGGEEPVLDGQVRCLRCHVGIGSAGSGGDIGVPRLRMFADLFLGDHVYSLIEVRTDRGEAPSDSSRATRVEQAYLRITNGGGSAGLQIGRFASPFGSYAQRHLTVADPFLRPPLPYDYRTVMSRTLVPVAGRFLTWKDKVGVFRKAGAPPVWEVPYQWGAMLFGTVGPVDLRVAAVNSAPSSDPDAWDFEWRRFDHPSLVAGARWTASPSLDVGVSYNRGPWMEKPIAGTILPSPDAPSGSTPSTYYDFDQEIVSADFAFARGPMVLRGEAMLDRWDIANVEEWPTERLYTAELQWDLWAGVSVAARAGYIDFQPLEINRRKGRRPEEWDYDVYRYEASLGYRLARNAGILLSGYRQIQSMAEDGDTHLIGARLWWAF